MTSHETSVDVFVPVRKLLFTPQVPEAVLERMEAMQERNDELDAQVDALESRLRVKDSFIAVLMSAISAKDGQIDSLLQRVR